MTQGRRIWTHQRGASYLALMFLIVVMSIGASAATKQWKTLVQREKEADLLSHGIEIQNAIGFYWQKLKLAGAVNGGYPLTLEELTKGPKPFLRKVYKEPMTAGDWEIVRDPATGRIKGVHSASTLTPIKEHEFPAAVAHFEHLTRYNEWVFQYPSPSMLQIPQGIANPVSPQPQSPGGPAGAPDAVPFPR
jgi:hypothetical protein